MARPEHHLFCEGIIGEVLRTHIDKVSAEVDAIPESQFINASDDELAEHIYSQMEVLPIELHEDQETMEQGETKLDVRHDPRRAIFDETRPCLVAAMRVTVTLPFSGDSSLLKLRPNRFAMSCPRGSVRGPRGGAQYIDFSFEYPTDTLSQEQVQRDVKENLEEIRSCVERANQEASRVNLELKERARQYITNRRERLAKHGKIAHALNIPLKKRPGAPDMMALPVKRRLVRPLPPVLNCPAEPGVSDADYEAILNTVRHAGRTFERTPSTYAVHDEEELRDFVLANLNSVYEGDATGEQFRKQGKTDICIEDQNRAAFVAECKIWRGEKELAAAVDQLLCYLTWRDCKTALILFNKDIAGFSALQGKLAGGIQQHPKHEADFSTDQAGEWRFRLRSAEDPDRKVILHVFLFNLFVSKSQNTRKTRQ